MFQEYIRFSRILFVGGNIPEPEVSAYVGLKIHSTVCENWKNPSLEVHCSTEDLSIEPS